MGIIAQSKGSAEPAESILNRLKDVDGPGSGLDADLLDGKQASEFEPAFAKNTAFNKNFGTAAGTITQGNDARLSDAREWTAMTATQAEAEAGISTERRAWTPERVAQAVAALSPTDTDTVDGKHASEFEPAFVKNSAFNKNFGTAAGTVCQGNDARLSNTRTPTLHSLAGAEHASATLAELNAKLADATLIDTNDSRLSDDRVPLSHGNDKHSEAYITADEAPVQSVAGKTGAVTLSPSDVGAEPAFSKNTAFNKNFGSTAGTVAEGNDPRLSDARTPVAHGHDAANITSGVLDIARLPQGALERLRVVADQTARFALTDVQNGDTVKQEDTGIMYRVVDDTMLDQVAGYVEYSAGRAAAVPWSGVEGRPSTYPPSSHKLNEHADCTGSTASRESTSTTLMLQAKGMNDHRTSGDHDGRYYTQTQLDTALAAKEPAFTKNTAFNKNFGTVAGTVCQGDDSRLSNSREWSATTVTQAEAEAGVSTERRAWTPERVAQAIAALYSIGADADTVDGIHASGLMVGGFKNKIINGNLHIWQRGFPAAGLGYGPDRWYGFRVGSDRTRTRMGFGTSVVIYPRPLYYMRSVVTSVVGAANYVVDILRIEDVNTLAGKTVTLSLWARELTGIKKLSIYLRQNFGTGGTPSDNVSTPAEIIQLGAEFQKFTLNFTLPDVAGKNLGTNNDHRLEVLIFYDAGTDFALASNNLGHQSGTFDITQVQLEEGSIATTFENRPYGIELFLCQRYYQTINLSAYYGFQGNYLDGFRNWVISLTPTMRGNPTVSIPGPGNTGGGISIQAATPNFIDLAKNFGNNTTSYYITWVTADAEL